MRRIALLTFLLVLASAPAAEAATRIVVRGAGFGHGIGMSQYGAYGFAQKGFGYERILKHYYRGTSLGRRAQPARAGAAAGQRPVSCASAARPAARAAASSIPRRPTASTRSGGAPADPRRRHLQRRRCA